MSRNIQTKELPKQCQNIDELFFLWKAAHYKDCANKCKGCIFPCYGNRKQDKFHNICKSDIYNIVRESFLPDGSLSEDIRKKHKILFVCREAHNDFKNVSNSDFFWMKDKENNDNKEDSYDKCIRKIADAFGASIEECAFMNINKRGGNSRCNFTRLRNYASTYSKFIEKEIRLLNPQKIIVLGNLPEEITNIFNKFNKNKPPKIYPRHPSAYTKKSLQEFIESIEKVQ